ncbi:MOFRL family protein [Microvirga ossetica]|uniref:MOFRL family protein n=1 Tax=Microvirga ossetica TaxID=1882682 RepID=UPI000C15C86E
MTKHINGSASAPVFRQLDHSSPSPAVPTLDASAFLANNDACGYFSRLDQLVMTGPALTNVNDFRAILIR